MRYRTRQFDWSSVSERVQVAEWWWSRAVAVSPHLPVEQPPEPQGRLEIGTKHKHCLKGHQLHVWFRLQYDECRW